MFLTIKPKPIITFLLIITFSFGLTFCLFRATQSSAESRFSYTIVLDAGHGGRDAGCSGINTGVSESEIALSITKNLESYLKNFGFNVVLTRTNSDGLYSQNVTNYKKSDMENRKKIIDNAKADMVVSLHLNSYPEITQKGAQAFYQEGSEKGENLANAIVSQLTNLLKTSRKEALKGDYYILKCGGDIPASIVECGFLSNPDEEALLITDDYQNEVAYAIFCGIVKYFGEGDPTIVGNIENV